MSWDVVVMNFRGAPPRALEELPPDWNPFPLGPASEVREAISVRLPGVDWSNPAWGVHVGDGFSIEFNAGDEDPIVSIMLHVRGGGDPLPSMIAFAKPCEWSLIDCSTGDFIDMDNPSRDSWEQFQAFRDRVMGRNDLDTRG